MILQGAMSALSAVRALEDRLRDADYVALGKRANLEILVAPVDASFAELKDEETLNDVLEVPFALPHVVAIQRALHAAVAQVGDARGELTRDSRFHSAFISFVLGFATGFVIGHRASALKTPIDRLSGRTIARCEDWGALVALYYLVIVDSRGIIDKKTDGSIYGIADRWRAFVRDPHLEPNPALQVCREVGQRAGECWQADQHVDVGAELAMALRHCVAGG